MKDYSAMVTVTIGLQAKDDDQANERAQEIADRLTLGPDTTGKAKFPSWYDDSVWEVAIEDVECNE